jgi:hypothetical protein
VLSRAPESYFAQSVHHKPYIDLLALFVWLPLFAFALLQYGVALLQHDAVQPLFPLSCVVSPHRVSQTRIALYRAQLVLMALRFEDLEEPAFGFLVIGLYEGKAHAGDGLLGLFASCEGQQTLIRNHFEPALLPLRLDVTLLNPYRQRAVRDRSCGPLRWTTVNEGSLLLP